MTDQSPWTEIRSELSELLAEEEARPLRPLLESIHSITAAQSMPPDLVRGLLRAVNHVQARARQGHDPRELVREVAGGSVQPEWFVAGDVNQPGGDYLRGEGDVLKATFVQVFANALPDIKSAEPEPTIPLSIVLLVMNCAEAHWLFSSEVDRDHPASSGDFDALRALLHQDERLMPWEDRYGETPGDWKPFADSNETIAAIIARLLNDVGQKYLNRIAPDFVDIRTLHERSNRCHLKQLRDRGGIVIVDVISLRHPVIQRSYRRSWLDAFPNTLVARVGPNDKALKIEQRVAVVLEEGIDFEFHNRFQVDRDARCEEIYEGLRFERWLAEQAPRLLPSEAKSKDDVRNYYFRGEGPN